MNSTSVQLSSRQVFSGGIDILLVNAITPEDEEFPLKVAKIAERCSLCIGAGGLQTEWIGEESAEKLVRELHSHGLDAHHRDGKVYIHY
jgi:hypothetical protein